ncbi:MAG: PD-(D/E)XK nuclease family protein [Gammaproteobacteria bacterium]|nr:PD-(D/E)XK nuclease family protein [Gammaproteobacteria bacterium]
MQNGNCRWSTQVSSCGKRLDMTCTNEKKQALIFEHKAWAQLHANQLEDYRQVGKQEFGEFAIVLITARPYQNEQNPDLHFLWRDVYSWLDRRLSKWLSDNVTGTDSDNADLEFVCRNFLTLLKKRRTSVFSSPSRRLASLP